MMNVGYTDQQCMEQGKWSNAATMKQFYCAPALSGVALRAADAFYGGKAVTGTLATLVPRK